VERHGQVKWTWKEVQKMNKSVVLISVVLIVVGISKNGELKSSRKGI